MELDRKKVVLIGAGLVGMSFAYAALNQSLCDELVLVDINQQRAEGEAMDLNHGLAFSSSHMRIQAGTYQDCSDADLAVICAVVAQKPGESRIDLLQRNVKVFQSIIGPVMASGFKGILLVATNPVDIMTQIAYTLSGLPARQVLGTGTTLDTARLRYLLGAHFQVDPRNVHAYVMGEHGDSEFVPWSQAMIATKPVLEICQQDGPWSMEPLKEIQTQVREAAQKIIQAKGATYYGIGMSLARVTRAILGHENSILTVSSLLQGAYGQKDVYAGAPCVVGGEGIRSCLELSLTSKELESMDASCSMLRETFQQLSLG